MKQHDILSMVVLASFLFVQCAGRFETVRGGSVRVHFSAASLDAAANNMDQTHDENFKMPPEKKETVTDKAGMLIVAAVAVGVAVASAVAIPLLLANQ